MSVRYDPQIIHKFAQQLYNRANFIILVCVIFGGLGGFALGVGRLSQSRDTAYIFGAVGALLGGLIGASLAFKYKLMAQTALCQVKIEQNTRRLGRPDIEVISRGE